MFRRVLDRKTALKRVNNRSRVIAGEMATLKCWNVSVCSGGAAALTPAHVSLTSLMSFIAYPE